METKGKPLLPEGIIQIPAFSICEIEIASKNDTSSQVKRGAFDDFKLFAFQS